MNTAFYSTKSDEKTSNLKMPDEMSNPKHSISTQQRQQTKKGDSKK